jgi:carboxyl-terminal processing protease
VTAEERRQVFGRIETFVTTKYFDPEFNGRNWPELVRQHTPKILGASDDEGFENAVNDLLGSMGTSHTHLLSPRTRVPSRNSINATFRAVTTESGPRWAFQDVQPGGPADQAGIKSGDILLAVDDQEVAPPRTPSFLMNSRAQVAVIHRNALTRRVNVEVNTPQPKYSECPYAEPQNVVASVLEDRIGYLKVSMFPGIIGVGFAHEVDAAMQKLRECDRLILDLRGNPGGGIGGLRLMSYLVPDKRPVGYSLTRSRAERGYRREDLPRLNGIPDQKWRLPLIALKFVGRDHSIVTVTEGRGPQRFHQRIVVVVNDHSAGAAEMVAGFVQENGLGQVVGTRTAGRLLAGKGFKVGHEYILVIPVGAYLSWAGRRYEGNGIDPDVKVEWSPELAQTGHDLQLREATRLAASA